MLGAEATVTQRADRLSDPGMVNLAAYTHHAVPVVLIQQIEQ